MLRSIVAVLLLLAAGACSRAERDAAQQQAETTAQQAGQEVKALGDAAADAARTAGDQVGEAAKVAGDQVADALVTLKVKTALLDKLGVDGGRIAVDAKAGDVTLQGVVKTESTAALAAEVARSVSGVVTVQQNIAVDKDIAGTVIDKQVDKAIDKTQSEIADALLETRVKARLIEAMGQAGLAIEVEAEGGVVSLSGTVPDQIRRDLAVQTASKTQGALRVADQLSISG